METMYLQQSMPIYEHYPCDVSRDSHKLELFKYQSLQGVHAFVLKNFTRKMSCSIDDIIDVQYSISSTKDFRNLYYDINALTVYVTNGFSYTFTRDENPNADGRLSDISYYSYIDVNTYMDVDEHDWVEHRVIYEEVTKLPNRIKEALSNGTIDGDIIVSVPPVKTSFIKHHKDLVKIDRRRKVPEIYKEWDETINYYPVTLMNRINVPESTIDTVYEPSVQTESFKPYPSIGWSDDEW